jgi:hypothetical protein
MENTNEQSASVIGRKGGPVPERIPDAAALSRRFLVIIEDKARGNL